MTHERIRDLDGTPFAYTWHLGPLHVRRPINRLGERWTIMLALPFGWAAVVAEVCGRRVRLIQPTAHWMRE